MNQTEKIYLEEAKSQAQWMNGLRKFGDKIEELVKSWAAQDGCEGGRERRFRELKGKEVTT